MIEDEIKVQGRTLSKTDVEFVRELIQTNPTWSRWRLSRELSKLWNWRNANGQIKDMACRSMLLKLEKQGYIHLPARRCIAVNRMLSKKIRIIENDQTPIVSPLKEIQSIRLVSTWHQNGKQEDAENNSVGKKRGAPKGHIGKTRAIPKDVNRTEIIPPPEKCPSCNGTYILAGDEYISKYVEDIDPIIRLTIEKRFTKGTCAHCNNPVVSTEATSGPPVTLGNNILLLKNRDASYILCVISKKD